MTAGFIAVFAVFGLVIAPLASGVQQYLPWVTLVVGPALVLAGLWLVAGRSLPNLMLPTIPTRRSGSRSKGLRRGVGSMVGFGVSYALASLTCTIGPFLAIVVSTLRIQQTLATFLLGVGPLRLAVILVALVAAVVISSRLLALRSRTASHSR